MTRDFGSRDRPNWRRGQRLAFLQKLGFQGALLIGFLIFAALPTLVAISPIGPSLAAPKLRPFKPTACQPITQAAFERGWKEGPRTFTFLGATFARRRGDADCQGRHAFMSKVYWPVCEFDVPFQLAVTVGDHTAYFAIPPGDTAVVEARGAAIRCAVIEAFDLPERLTSRP